MHTLLKPVTILKLQILAPVTILKLHPAHTYTSVSQSITDLKHDRMCVTNPCARPVATFLMGQDWYPETMIAIGSEEYL